MIPPNPWIPHLRWITSEALEESPRTYPRRWCSCRIQSKVVISWCQDSSYGLFANVSPFLRPYLLNMLYSTLQKIERVLSKKIEKCYDIYIFTLWFSIPIVLSILGLLFMEIMKPGSMPGNPAVARQGEQRDFLFSETGPWKTTPRLFDYCTSWGPPKDS